MVKTWQGFLDDGHTVAMMAQDRHMAWAALLDQSVSPSIGTPISMLYFG